MLGPVLGDHDRVNFLKCWYPSKSALQNLYTPNDHRESMQNRDSFKNIFWQILIVESCSEFERTHFPN